MAVFPPYFDGLMECRVEQTMPNGAQAVSVYFGVAELEPAPTPADLATFAGHIRSFYNDLALASLSDQWSLDQTVTLARNDATPFIEYDATQIVGSTTDPPLPVQTQLVVTWRTAIAGRRYRGRNFIGGWTEDSSTAAGNPEPLTIGQLQLSASTLITNLATDDMALVVLSRGNTSPPAPVAWTGFFTAVTSASVDNKWDVLRSRRS